MKKIRLVVVALLATLSMSAENTTKLRVWMIGGTKTEYELSMVDSLTFYTDTVQYESLPGVFSVSDNQQVRFSKGNLQYTQGTDTWAFASQQYEYLGTDNVVTYELGDNELADRIDLFGWSCTVGNARWGVSASMNYNDYIGDFRDWGLNIEDGSTWRTLSVEEWKYLFEKRKNANYLWSRGTVNGIKGMIILPDNFERPKNIYWIYQASSWTTNTYTLSQWVTLEASGAVFLPAAGSRGGANYGNGEYGNGDTGFYWTSSGLTDEMAYNVMFTSTKSGAGWSNKRYYGFSVRLVQDL